MTHIMQYAVLGMAAGLAFMGDAIQSAAEATPTLELAPDTSIDLLLKQENTEQIEGCTHFPQGMNITIPEPEWGKWLEGHGYKLTEQYIYPGGRILMLQMQVDGPLYENPTGPGYYVKLHDYQGDFVGYSFHERTFSSTNGYDPEPTELLFHTKNGDFYCTPDENGSLPLRRIFFPELAK